MSIIDIPKPNFEIKTSEEIRNDRNQSNEKDGYPRIVLNNG